MKQVFADATYWIALINPRDGLHQRAQEVSKNLGNVRIFTSEMVLTEVLNGLGGKGETVRKQAAEMVGKIMSNVNVEVLPQTSALFKLAFSRFHERSDKAWGLTDCSSFVIMEDRGLSEALTSDHHYTQAGFKALLESQ